MTKPTLRKLPFWRVFHPLIKSGRKTLTTRLKRWGKPGDIMRVNNYLKVEILAVQRMELQKVAYFMYQDEGLENPAMFIDIWKKIHPGQGFRPQQMVYVHQFRVVS